MEQLADRRWLAAPSRSAQEACDDTAYSTSREISRVCEAIRERPSMKLALSLLERWTLAHAALVQPARRWLQEAMS